MSFHIIRFTEDDVMTTQEKMHTIELSEHELARVLSSRDRVVSEEQYIPPPRLKFPTEAEERKRDIGKIKAFVDEYEAIIRLQRYALR